MSVLKKKTKVLEPKYKKAYVSEALDERYCPKCNRRFKQQVMIGNVETLPQICPICKVNLQESNIICPSCGTTINMAANRICSYCGKVLRARTSNEQTGEI